MQETRLRWTETRAREGCQEFRERSGCVESLSTVNGQFECQQDCSSLSVAERGVSFQDRRFLAIGTSREDNLCNEMSRDGVIVCHSSSTLYMMSYITFLQEIRHNFCNRRERKLNRPFTRPIFPVRRKIWERDSPGTDLTFISVLFSKATTTCKQLAIAEQRHRHGYRPFSGGVATGVNRR